MYCVLSCTFYFTCQGWLCGWWETWNTVDLISEVLVFIEYVWSHLSTGFSNAICHTCFIYGNIRRTWWNKAHNMQLGFISFHGSSLCHWLDWHIWWTKVDTQLFHSPFPLSWSWIEQSDNILTSGCHHLSYNWTYVCLDFTLLIVFWGISRRIS